MANLKTCDLCKRTEPAVTFGTPAAPLPNNTVVVFHDPRGVPSEIIVEARAHCHVRLDVCSECTEKALTAGIAEIAKLRAQQTHGMFVVGGQTQARVDRGAAIG